MYPIALICLSLDILQAFQVYYAWSEIPHSLFHTVFFLQVPCFGEWLHHPLSCFAHNPGTDMISLSLTSYIPSITKSLGVFLFPEHLSTAHLPVTPLSFSPCGPWGLVWIPLKSSTWCLSICSTFLPSIHFSHSLTARMTVKNANLVISWHFLNFWWYQVRKPYQDLGAKDLGSSYFCHHDTSLISVDFPQLHWTSCSNPS